MKGNPAKVQIVKKPQKVQTMARPSVPPQFQASQPSTAGQMFNAVNTLNMGRGKVPPTTTKGLGVDGVSS